MKTAQQQYEQDRETFEAAEFEYNEARTTWARETRDGEFNVEIEWVGEAYNVQAIPYDIRKSQGLNENRDSAESAIKVADDFQPGRSFEFDRDDKGAPADDSAEARFDAVELSPVAVYLSGDGRQEICEPVHSFDEYERLCELNDVVRVVYSVYGHLTEGGVECLADADTPDHARLLGAALAKYWRVEINDLIVEIPQS